MLSLQVIYAVVKRDQNFICFASVFHTTSDNPNDLSFN